MTKFEIFYKKKPSDFDDVLGLLRVENGASGSHFHITNIKFRVLQNFSSSVQTTYLKTFENQHLIG